MHTSVELLNGGVEVTTLKREFHELGKRRLAGLSMAQHILDDFVDAVLVSLIADS